MKHLILSAIVLGSTLSFAQQRPMPPSSSCLQRVGNYELVAEINRRLASSPGPINPVQDDAILTLSCNSYILQTSSTSLTTGQTEKKDFSLGSSSQCNELRNALDVIVKGPLYQNKLVASCNSYILQKFLVTTDKKIQKLADESLGSSSQCQQTAAQINGIQ